MDRSEPGGMELAILDAAEYLFLEKGFSMVSTTEIAKRVGCNQALVHYYFRTKDNLFEAVFARKAPLFLSALFKSGLEDLSFEERLKVRIAAHIDVLKANPRIPFLLINELYTNPKRLESVKDRTGKALKEAVKKLQAELDEEADKGRFKKVDALDFVMSLVALNVGLFILLPVYKAVFQPSTAEIDRRIEKRKKDNLDMAIAFLREG